MNCPILSGPFGCGKMTALLQRLIAQPGRHFLAAPRIDLLDEHAARLRHLAKSAGVVVTTHVVHSGQSQRGGVLRRLQQTIRDCPTTRHAVVLATHEAFLALDPILLAGWHIGLDELPDTSVASGSFSASTTWSALAHQYRLEKSDDERWWRVVPRDDVEPLSLSEVTRGASELRPLSGRILR